MGVHEDNQAVRVFQAGFVVRVCLCKRTNGGGGRGGNEGRGSREGTRCWGQQSQAEGGGGERGSAGDQAGEVVVVVWSWRRAWGRQRWYGARRLNCSLAALLADGECQLQ